MKKNFLILLLSSLALTSCSFDSITNLFNKNGGDNEQEQNQNQNNDDNKNTDDNKDDSSTTTDDDDQDNRYISFGYREYDLVLGKSEDFLVYFHPTDEAFTDAEKEGVFTSSDESVAEVSYGRITGKGVGKAVITYTTNVNGYVASMIVYVHESSASITRKYIQVDDVDDIKVGDELIFACKDFGVAASNNKKDYYIDTTSDLTFSGNELSNISEDVAEFLVCPGKNDSPDCFTLQIYDGNYLAAKQTDRHRSLCYFKTQKAQVDWIIERPAGYAEDYVVNYDLRDDYWLMFNKIDNTDIRFNLYDSNETALMKKPTIYRKTIIR